MQVNPTSKTVEYTGAVVQQCRAISSVPNGGQIICNAATLEGIRPRLVELGKCCVDTTALNGPPNKPECVSYTAAGCCPTPEAVAWLVLHGHNRLLIVPFCAHPGGQGRKSDGCVRPSLSPCTLSCAYLMFASWQKGA